jgi:DNA mismatch endonuclease (patch repair protein)
MRAVRQAGTTPELVARRALTELGVKYRCNVRSLPGSPDLANKRRRFAVFVNGCFWHRHDCGRATVPKTNAAFWKRKFHENIRRDTRNIAALRALGYRVVVIWECSATDYAYVRDILAFELIK